MIAIHAPALSLRILSIAAFFLSTFPCSNAVPWSSTLAIRLGSSNVVRFQKDPQRPYAYALDHGNDQVLRISLADASVVNRIYIGKRPGTCDIDPSGKFLYVGNEGVGTGLPGSFQIAEIDLTTFTKTRSINLPADLLINSPIRADNIVAGRPGLLYYNSGYDIWNYGYAGTIDLATGRDLGGLPAIKSPMVISSDKSRLYGQFVYEGNLGKMGAWRLSSNAPELVDSFPYSPYPYGWDYNNYSISGDDSKLALGYVLFNATNLVDQLGLFTEMIYALNHDGSLAFGSTSIWDTTSFPINGNPTKVQALPFSTDMMQFLDSENTLYALNKSTQTLHLIEPGTAHGVPQRWLLEHSIPFNDEIESSDSDHDGLSVLDEWTLDEDPTTPTDPIRIEITEGRTFRIPARSPRRIYAIEGWDGRTPRQWSRVLETRGNGSTVSFDPSTNNYVIYRASVSMPN